MSIFSFSPVSEVKTARRREQNRGIQSTRDQQKTQHNRETERIKSIVARFTHQTSPRVHPRCSLPRREFSFSVHVASPFSICTAREEAQNKSQNRIVLALFKGFLARPSKRNVLSCFSPRLKFTARSASLVERVATDTHGTGGGIFFCVDCWWSFFLSSSLSLLSLVFFFFFQSPSHTHNKNSFFLLP